MNGYRFADIIVIIFLLLGFALGFTIGVGLYSEIDTNATIVIVATASISLLIALCFRKQLKVFDSKTKEFQV